MNKAELIDAVADSAGISKYDATAAVDATLDAIKRAVARGDKVSISGFGIFEKSERAARTGRNPQTGMAVLIAATSVPKFRAGAEFKIAVSGKAHYLSRHEWSHVSLPLGSFRHVPSTPGAIHLPWQRDELVVGNLAVAIQEISNNLDLWDFATGIFGDRKIYYREVHDLDTLREISNFSPDYNASRRGRPNLIRALDDAPNAWGIYRIKRQDMTAYVGLATDLRTRLTQHADSGKLQFERRDTVEVILAERSTIGRLIMWDNLAAAEKHHIAKTRGAGYTLDNSTDGGNGRTPEFGYNP